MGYKTHAFKSISWMGLLRGATRGVAFIRLAILARILSPAQFGVFGVASLILALLEVLTDTGINVFLIQKKEESSDYISSAWIVSIARGILIATLLVVLAPFIAKFFNSPASYNVILLIAIAPFIRGFINPSIINTQKDIQFHKEFYVRTTLLFIDAATAITVAFITKSAQSLAWGLIISALFEVALSFLFFKPRPRLSLNIAQVKHIGGRGWWVTLTGIFVYLSENLDNITVGKMLGTEALGLYQSAYKISTLTISEINEVVNKVTFPVYTKLADDKDRLRRAFFKVVLTTSAAAFVLGIFIFIFAEQIVLIILGPSWTGAIPVVRVLAFYGILRTFFGNFSAFFLSLEKQNYVAATTLVRLVVLIAVIVPLISVFGMVGAGYAMLISIIAEIPVIAYFTNKVLRK
jgi:O-antigen/teichoic acid export membrane protein